MSISDTENRPCLERLGMVIRRRRKALGFTLREFAALAEVSMNFLSQVERGKTTAHIGKILDILFAAGLQFEIAEGRNRIAVKDAVA